MNRKIGTRQNSPLSVLYIALVLVLILPLTYWTNRRK